MAALDDVLRRLEEFANETRTEFRRIDADNRELMHQMIELDQLVERLPDKLCDKFMYVLDRPTVNQLRTKLWDDEKEAAKERKKKDDSITFRLGGKKVIEVPLDAPSLVKVVFSKAFLVGIGASAYHLLLWVLHAAR